MSDPVRKLRRHLRELRRRNVVQVGATYLVVAFVVVQLADLAAGAFALPGWFEPLVWIFCGLGFPIALVIAWAFELTDEGIRRAPRPEPSESRFPVDEEVCAHLDRSRLDPRMIGDHLIYLDNHARSSILVCYLHAFGLDAEQHREVLRDHPHRAVAPTLFGFEPERSVRIALDYDDHVKLLREFLRRLIANIEPEITVLVGVSSGADTALRIVGDPDGDLPSVDGILALGPNFSAETLFVTRLFAHLEEGAADELPSSLARVSEQVATLEEWLVVHEYLVRALRKFEDDLEPLRRMARGIVRPFEEEGTDAFVRAFRSASERVEAVICVAADSPAETEPLQRIKMMNLDEKILGPRFRPGSLRVARGASHFDLDDPALQERHLQDLLDMIDGTAEIPSRLGGTPPR